MPRNASSNAPTKRRVPGGVVHDLPDDLREALSANDAALAAWHDITPLARNEYAYASQACSPLEFRFRSSI